MPSRRNTAATFLSLVSLLLPSCNWGPSRVKQPAINAAGAGAAAVAQYDKNGDGKISGEELDKAPALKAALKTLDADGDKAVSADEVAARVKVWQGTGAGVMLFRCAVSLNGAPLEGATVTFEPEAFLGDDVKQAVAVTDEFGSGGPTIPKELRAPGNPPGVHLGLYRVRVSKIVNGKETIPAKYNTESILGQEVARDVPEIANQRVAYALSTK